MTTEQLAEELEQILDANEMLKWNDLPSLIKDDWIRVANHVLERERKLQGAKEHMQACRCLVKCPDDDVLYSTLEGMVEREQKLQEALEKYGIHKNRCDMFPISLVNPRKCTCGFDAAKELLK